MPDLETFENEVKQKINTLSSSKDAKARRKAAAWLGEAGDPTAITALNLAYKNDRDTGVRDAARYSLGMFRALEAAWNKDQEMVGQLLEDVAINDKMGRRVPVAVRSVVKLEVGLLLAAALIAGFALLWPMLQSQLQLGGLTNPPAAGVDRDSLLDSLRAQWQTINRQTEALRQTYLDAISGKAPNCDLDFTPAVALSDAARRDHADLAAIADGLQTAQQQLTAARAPFDQACAAGQPVAAPPLAELGQVSAKLAEVEAQLTQANGGAAPAATEAAVSTTAPTPAPVVDVRSHVAALQTIIDQVTDNRTGAAALLVQYWTDAKGSGATVGCREPQPVIPADYTLPLDVAQAAPTLGQAAQWINTGLMGLRTGWTAFTSACQRNTLGPEATAALTSAQAAQQTFTLADTVLSDLRN